MGLFSTEKNESQLIPASGICVMIEFPRTGNFEFSLKSNPDSRQQQFVIRSIFLDVSYQAFKTAALLMDFLSKLNIASVIG